MQASVTKIDDLVAEIAAISEEMARSASCIKRKISDDAQLRTAQSSQAVQEATAGSALHENAVANVIADLYDRLGGFLPANQPPS